MTHKKAEQKEDLRIQRTRGLILNAFIELVVEKGFAAVTVQDITERAMVNRSTFYRHYLDKFDLVDKYLEQVYELVSEVEVTAENVGMMHEESPSGLVRMLKHVEAHGDFYRVMLGPKGDPHFTERFLKMPEKRFRYFLSLKPADNSPNALPVDLRLNYIAYADVGAILWWLDNNQPCSVEQLARWLNVLTSASAGFTQPQSG